ncbi:MAG: fumarylacetoacetate hydrolase family protein [Gammaproteobacteria bacterium]|nr:fumarylacetoacetate hydrolase family protein [Gammaproteobacteria bacterium]
MRIFCIGRNYVEHAKELGNAVPIEPVVFMKPYESLVPKGEDIQFPRHGQQLQHELEVVVQIKAAGKPTTESEARAMIAGLALGLDLTLRDLQNALKAQGLPWEKAKSFEHSATLSEFLPYHSAIDLAAIEFSCTVNDSLRQHGNTGQMLFSIEQLIVTLSSIWSLQKGDLIYTGTPAGVGDLKPGDKVTVLSPQLGQASWNIKI